MTTFLFESDIWVFSARVGGALLCCSVIGIERQCRGLQAGLRTNAFVSVGAATFTYLSATAFGAVDEGRVAAQIVSGIGFLGAGVVLHRGESLQGLNTAATIWGVAAIGMAAGAGSYHLAVPASIAVLAVQVLFRPLAHIVDRAPSQVDRVLPATTGHDGWLSDFRNLFGIDRSGGEDAEAATFDASHRSRTNRVLRGIHGDIRNERASNSARPNRRPWRSDRMLP